MYNIGNVYFKEFPEGTVYYHVTGTCWKEWRSGVFRHYISMEYINLDNQFPGDVDILFENMGDFHLSDRKWKNIIGPHKLKNRLAKSSIKFLFGDKIMDNNLDTSQDPHIITYNDTETQRQTKQEDNRESGVPSETSSDTQKKPSTKEKKMQRFTNFLAGNGLVQKALRGGIFAGRKNLEAALTVICTLCVVAAITWIPNCRQDATVATMKSVAGDVFTITAQDGTDVSYVNKKNMWMANDGTYSRPSAEIQELFARTEMVMDNNDGDFPVDPAKAGLTVIELQWVSPVSHMCDMFIGLMDRLESTPETAATDATADVSETDEV